MSPRTKRYSWKWRVQWDNHQMGFATFEEAKKWLIDELIWLAIDLDHNPTWEARDQVTRWEYVPKKVYVVEAGFPPSTYRLREMKLDDSSIRSESQQ